MYVCIHTHSYLYTHTNVSTSPHIHNNNNRYRKQLATDLNTKVHSLWRFLPTVATYWQLSERSELLQSSKSSKYLTVIRSLCHVNVWVNLAVTVMQMRKGFDRYYYNERHCRWASVQHVWPLWPLCSREQAIMWPLENALRLLQSLDLCALLFWPLV